MPIISPPSHGSIQPPAEPDGVIHYKTSFFFMLPINHCVLRMFLFFKKKDKFYFKVDIVYIYI